MSQYVFAQPFAWGRPTVNAKTIVGFARDRRFKADDTLLFSASALTGFVSGEHLTSANFETVRAAFAKVLRDAKSAAPALVLPVITPEGRKVYRVQGGAFTEIPAVPRSGALWVRKEDMGLPFDVYFNETPFCGREKTFEGSDYVVIDPTAYDASRVYPGFCRVVLSGKRRANYVAPETYFDVSATKVNPCGANVPWNR